MADQQLYSPKKGVKLGPFLLQPSIIEGNGGKRPEKQ